MRGCRTIRSGGLIGLLALVSCTGERPTHLGVVGNVLTPCPETPNCVSSDAPDEAHFIEPFTLSPPTESAWREVRDAMRGLPRVTVLEASDDYLRAEFVSALFRFVDDVELHRREDIVAVRSASRLGRSDLGVNRKRIEEIRELLQASGTIR